MKRFLLIIGLFLYCLLLSSTNHFQEKFREANQHYRNDDFEIALESYLKLEQDGLINADLFYNTGNCFFRIQNLGKAILYYKKALKVNPDHQLSQQNLEFAQTFTQDKQYYESNDFMSVLKNKFLDKISINTFAIINLFLFFCITLTIILLLTRYRYKEKAIPIFILLLLIIIIAVSSLCSYIKWNNYHDDSQAVLISNSAIGYSGPRENYTRVFTIHEGLIFTIEKSQKGWSLIKLPNGIGGWIKSDNLERIKFLTKT